MTNTVFFPAVLPWRIPGFAALVRPSPPPASSDTPGPAVHALKDRDPVAWQTFFEREMPGVFRYARGRLGDSARAEDATAEVFESAWRSVDGFEDRGLPPRAWLYGIARNVVANHRRWLFRQPPQLTLEAFDASRDEPGMSPDRIDLVRAIAALEPAHAEVITLRFVHDLSLEDTAGAIGASVDAVKGRQARALAALREILTGA